MARVVGGANPVPFGERTFLTQKDLANHTGIGISCIRKIMSGGEFQDYVVVGKQHKIMVDRAAFEKFIKDKKYI